MMTIMVAGGGTGGHVYPALSIANEFLKQVPGARVVCVGTRQGMEKELLANAGFSPYLIFAPKFKGQGFLIKLKTIIALPVSFLSALVLICKLRPTMIVGVGGYASFSVVCVGYCLGVATFISEQNAIPGLANRVLSRCARKIFVAFPYSTKFFKKEKVVLTGNPMRKEIIEYAAKKVARTDAASILVIGGSQGAKKLNDVIIDVIPDLAKRFNALTIYHITGPRHYLDVKRMYPVTSGVHVELYPYVNNMGELYAKTDLIISRSGSGILEFLHYGVPSILIPYRYASGDHQTFNARYFEEHGVSVMIQEDDLTHERLLIEIQRALMDNSHRDHVRHESQKMAISNASERIVSECIASAKKGKK